VNAAILSKLRGLSLLGLTLLAFFPALSGGFIWDDDAHLTANPCIVGPLGLADIWTIAHARICPLVQTTFWLEHRLWDLDPLPYHLFNVVLHAAAALVLWRVLLILRVPGAWLGAALWALHPVQVESVAWITEMKNTQSGLFFLLTVLFFCKSRPSETPHASDSRTTFNYILTIVFAALALASKSSTVILPLVLGLCGWWLDRGWRWRRNLLQLAPLALLSVASGVVTLLTQQAEGAFDAEFARSGAERFASLGKVVWFYLGKLIWPHPLIFIYPKWRIDPSSFSEYLPTLALASLMIVLWWQRDRWARTAFFAAAFFVAALLPVLGLIDTYFWRYSFVGDHLQYLASMGPLALAGAGIHTGLSASRIPPPWLRRAVGPLLLVTLGLISWRQCGQYRNDETLWTATLQLNPESWIAHNNLATDIARQPGRSDEAIEHYEAALRLRPRHAKAHYNLAQELRRIPGRQDEAIAHFEAALRIDPTLALAHLNLGVLLAAKPDRRAEVISHYSEALRLQPDLAEAHYNLALALTPQPDEANEAEAHFMGALRLRPDWADARIGYAILLSRMTGRAAEAITQYKLVLRSRPNDVMLHYGLAEACYRSGRLDDAINELETTLALDPNFEDARRQLTALRHPSQ